MGLLCWPSQLPDDLSGLHEEIAEALGEPDVTVVDDVSALIDPANDWERAIVVADGAADREALGVVAEELSGTSDMPTRRVVFVVADGMLGTDAEDMGVAMQSAVAVAIARSIAVRRGDRHRANVVCIPEAMFGVRSSQRGPLSHPVGLADVVNSVGFLLGDDATYLNGQLLFVDSGRHLFSSLSA